MTVGEPGRVWLSCAAQAVGSCRRQPRGSTPSRCRTSDSPTPTARSLGRTPDSPTNPTDRPVEPAWEQGNRGPSVRQQNPTIGLARPLPGTGRRARSDAHWRANTWIPGMSQSAGSATPGFRPARPRVNACGGARRGAVRTSMRRPRATASSWRHPLTESQTRASRGYDSGSAVSADGMTVLTGAVSEGTRRLVDERLLVR